MIILSYLNVCVCVCVLVAQLCPTLCDPDGLEPTRLLCPWDSPGKNTGVGCHFLLVMLNNLPKVHIVMGFPGSSAGKESTCNPGDPSSIPQLRRSPGEGDGYTLQYKESDKTEQHSFT